MQLDVFKDYDSLSAAAAKLIRDYILKKPNAMICIASGHTPVGTFKLLIQDIASGKLNVSQCTFVSLDEWIGIDPNDRGSCLSMLQRDFFGPARISKNQIIFFDVLREDLEQECDRINQLIAANSGLDIMLVGVGTNGHIGMNEPGTPFNTYAHLSDLAEETKTVGQKYFDKATVLAQGITLGLRHLTESKLPIVMASGKSKSAIMKKGLTVSPSPAVPLSIIQEISHARVLLDDDAAAEYFKV